MTLREALERLLARHDLTEAEARGLLESLTQPEVAPAVAGALLAALRAKGVTADEVRGFAGTMRTLARVPRLPQPLDAIDIVGTGGDGSGSLNLSTAAALLTAACGTPVVKHGNRSISSRSGSADLMESLGLAMPLDEVRCARLFADTGFTFLFAPYFHPAMKALAGVRAALGIRTVFNLLGPLTNPAAPRHHLIGAYDAATAALMADTLAGMDVARAWVVHGAAGWDEVTPIGPFIAYDIEAGSVRKLEIDPQQFGIARCTPADLAGGDAAANAAALLEVFERRDRGAHFDAITLQAGIAMHIAARAPSLEAGIGRARAAIDDGSAGRWLERLRHWQG
jgi:anthranilate phosphoribosyltransferase